MKTYVFEPVHLLNALLVVINCVLIMLLVSGCSAKLGGPGYTSLSPIDAPAASASSPTAPDKEPESEPTLATCETEFMATMLHLEH
jgi:hypothetical protein